MWRNAVGPTLVSLGLIAVTVFTPMAIVMRLSEHDTITLGQGIDIFATFITGGLVLTAAVWLSWTFAR